jgi:Fic family protein
MLIPPRYTLNDTIAELLQSIEASREVVDSISIPLEIEQNIRRQSTLRSALYSARIEGNELTLETVSSTPSKLQKKVEVTNTLKAMNWITKRRNKDIALKDILELHKMTMDGLSPDAGKFRNHHEAIYNSAGIAVYMPPPPKQMNLYLRRLIKYINSPKEKFIPVKAAMAHFVFEKIHPFEDGSGRVGRLLIQKILWQGGYGMKGLLPLEEYLDNNRPLYYRALEEPEKDATDYLIFLLEAIKETALATKILILSKQKAETSDFLLPRRGEIYNLIKDHKLMNFDQIRRRFRNVNQRTLRYDLKKLQDAGLIRKLGNTKGVYYQLPE